MFNWFRKRIKAVSDWVLKQQIKALDSAPNIIKKGLKEEVEMYRGKHNGEIPTKYYLLNKCKETHKFMDGCKVCGITMADLDLMATDVLARYQK